MLAPVFAHMDPAHAKHVAAFIAEVLGGPADYSRHHGGHAHMIRKHLGRSLNERNAGNGSACCSTARRSCR
jgi:hemoglobin